MELPEESVFSNLYFNEKAARESLFVWADKLVVQGGEYGQVLGTYVLQMLHAECDIRLIISTGNISRNMTIVFTSDKANFSRNSPPAPIIGEGSCCGQFLWSLIYHENFGIVIGERERNSGYSSSHKLSIKLDGLQYFD